jgi:uncharacterized protein YjiS (DUF1127 family)
MTIAQTCSTERTSRSSTERLGGLFIELTAWLRRRRQIRRSRAVLDTLNDRQLADIGLWRIDTMTAASARGEFAGNFLGRRRGGGDHDVRLGPR